MPFDYAILAIHFSRVLFGRIDVKTVSLYSQIDDFIFAISEGSMCRSSG
jgi:hypothetical protein